MSSMLMGSDALLKSEAVGSSGGRRNSGELPGGEDNVDHTRTETLVGSVSTPPRRR